MKYPVSIARILMLTLALSVFSVHAAETDPGAGGAPALSVQNEASSPEGENESGTSSEEETALSDERSGETATVTTMPEGEDSSGEHGSAGTEAGPANAEGNASPEGEEEGAPGLEPAVNEDTDPEEAGPGTDEEETGSKNGLITEENGKTFYYIDDVPFIGQKEIEGFRYMFMPDTGEMVTGFYEIPATYNGGKKKTCFFDESGHMLFGQKKLDDFWYMFDKDSGEMQTGFVAIPSQNKIVYYSETGAVGEGLGRMQYGQKKIDGYWYNFKQGSGAMQTGFVKISSQNKTVYYSKDGAMGEGLGRMQYGQKKIDGYWYNFKHGTGAMQTGFVKIPSQNKICYYNEKGRMQYGQKKIDGYWYNFNKNSGAMRTGFVNIPEQNKVCYYSETGTAGKGLGQMQYGQKKIGGYWYNFTYGSGAMKTGFVRIPSQDKTVYYSETGAIGKGRGRMQYGQKRIGEDWYMFRSGTGAMATGWFFHTKQTNSGTVKVVYYDPGSGKMLKGTHKIGKTTFRFNEGSGALAQVVHAELASGLPGYKIPYTSPNHNVRTIKNYLRTAFVPCGRTLWCWGGGHGADSNIKGYPKSWENFFVSHANGYSATMNFMSWTGPDCSGYVSWVGANAFYSPDAKPGSFLAADLPRVYANRGWATYTENKGAKYKPGDVVAMATHVWICLGQYEDGSILLVHNSSPGVQIGGFGGMAKKKADYYMAKYFPYFPRLTKNCEGYASRGHQHASWIPGRFLTDPEGMQNMHPDQVMKMLLGD